MPPAGSVISRFVHWFFEIFDCFDRWFIEPWEELGGPGEEGRGRAWARRNRAQVAELLGPRRRRARHCGSFPDFMPPAGSVISRFVHWYLEIFDVFDRRFMEPWEKYAEPAMTGLGDILNAAT